MQRFSVQEQKAAVKTTPGVEFYCISQSVSLLCLCSCRLYNLGSWHTVLYPPPLYHPGDRRFAKWSQSSCTTEATAGTATTASPAPAATRSCWMEPASSWTSTPQRTTTCWMGTPPPQVGSNTSPGCLGGSRELPPSLRRRLWWIPDPHCPIRFLEFSARFGIELHLEMQNLNIVQRFALLFPQPCDPPSSSTSSPAGCSAHPTDTCSLFHWSSRTNGYETMNWFVMRTETWQ